MKRHPNKETQQVKRQRTINDIFGLTKEAKPSEDVIDVKPIEVPNTNSFDSFEEITSLETVLTEAGLPLRNCRKEITHYALLDEEDHERLKHLKWRFHTTSLSAYRGNWPLNRAVLDLTDMTVRIIHINGDKLDCRKCNLKVISNIIASSHLDSSVREIPLRNKQKEIVAKALIDSDDYERVIKHWWQLNKNGYPQSNAGVLHRFVMNAEPGVIIDHINNNKLNATKQNLRIATASLNAQNRTKSKGVYTSDYLGVSFNNSNQCWVASFKGRSEVYKSEADAAFVS